MNMERSASTWYLSPKKGAFMKKLLSFIGSIVMFAGTASAFELQIGPIKTTQDLKSESKKDKLKEIKKIDIKDAKDSSAITNCTTNQCWKIKND